MVSHYRDENIPLIRDFWFSFITFVKFVWKNKKAQHCRPMARIFRSHSFLTNQVLCNIMMRLWNMFDWNYSSVFPCHILITNLVISLANFVIFPQTYLHVMSWGSLLSFQQSIAHIRLRIEAKSSSQESAWSIIYGGPLGLWYSMLLFIRDASCKSCLSKPSTFVTRTIVLSRFHYV